MTVKFFGQFLLLRGRITREQLLTAVEQQKAVNVRLGTLAMDHGYMKAADVERVNLLQRTLDMKFGEIAISQGLLTPDQVDRLLGEQRHDRLLLGEALVQKGFLTLETLAQELAAFHNDQEGIPAAIIDVYVGLPNAPMMELIADVVAKMFRRVADERVKIASCHRAAPAVQFYDVTVHQEIRRGFAGTFGLNLTADLMARIASKMAGEAMTESDELATDGVAEFVNVICGNVCAKLSSLGVTAELGPPQVHDHRAGARFDLAGRIGAGAFAVTQLLTLSGSAEFWVIDRSPRKA